jgi:hypothetical protein
VSGRFPTGVDINVWFGQRAVQSRTFSPSQLLVTVPSGLTPGTVDVSVRFNRSGLVVLLLEDGYTYQPDGVTSPPSSGSGAASGSSSGTASGTTTGGTTTPPSAGGSGGSGAGQTTGSPPPPSTTTNPTNPSTPTNPGTPPPSGGGGSSATTPGNTTPRGITVSRGPVVLRSAPAGSPIAGLSPQRWSTPCSTSCSAVSL